MGEETANFRAWVANGGKKKIGAHSATAGGAIMATIIAIQTIFGPLSGLAEIPNLKVKADSTVAVVAKVDTLEKSLDRIEANLTKLMMAQGVRPEPKDRPETVVIFYVDSVGRGVYTHGDTAFVPRDTPNGSPR